MDTNQNLNQNPTTEGPVDGLKDLSSAERERLVRSALVTRFRFTLQPGKTLTFKLEQRPVGRV